MEMFYPFAIAVLIFLPLISYVVGYSTKKDKILRDCSLRELEHVITEKKWKDRLWLESKQWASHIGEEKKGE